MWTLKGLIAHASSTQVLINGKWVSARPLNWKYRSFRQRLKEAWSVFVGKAEAFTWPQGQ